MSIRRWFPVVLVMISLLAAALACAPGGAPAAQPEEQAAVEQPAEQVVEPTAEPSPTSTETPLPPTPTPEPTIAPTDPPPPTEAPLTAEDVGATAAASAPIVIEAAGSSAESIEEAWQQAYALPAGVPFSVTITDAQLEARVAQAMAASPYGGSNFANLDVVLDNGQVGMTFSFSPAAAPGRSLSGSAFFYVTVDAQGEIVVTVASAQVTGATIGSFSIPPEMLTALNEALTLAFAGTSVQQQAGVPGQVVFTAVTIDDGYATITGYVVPEM